ncbi:MAG: hypothetical protein ABIZ18_03295 [Caldimonas sp.]
MYALAAWAGVAFLIHGLPSGLLLGVALFAAVTAACVLIGMRSLPRGPVSPGKTNAGSLLLRGVLAAVLVAGVTLMSDRLGPVVSGLLLSFPIGSARPFWHRC